MSENKHRLSVDIHGQTYHMRSSGDESRVLQIVDYVNQMMDQIASQQPGIPYRDLAVLTALNIGEAYFNLQADYTLLAALLEEENGR